MRRILLAALLSLAGLASAPAEQQQPNAGGTEQTKATPEVIEALRERFPAVQGDKVNVRDSIVDFYTGHWHMACSLMLNPVRLSNCHVVHA